MGKQIISGMKFRYFGMLGIAMILFGNLESASGQQNTALPTPTPAAAASSQYVDQDGSTLEKLIESAGSRRADLVAARQRLAIAEGRLLQAGLRPNPTLNSEYGSTRFLGGEAETDLAVGVSQTFELGGKRNRRVALAQAELNQTRAEVLAIERQLAVEIRTSYTNAIAAARQLDALQELIAADEEIVRATEARLKEGDVAPLDVNLVKVEADRLRVQAIQAKSDLETQIIQLKTAIGADMTESLRLAPQPDRPPRLDMSLSELSDLAFRERADLQAAKLGEQLGSARIDLAKANAVPNIAGSVTYSRTVSVVDFPARLGGGSFANAPDNALVFGVSVDIPLFNRNQGEIASATGEKVQATRQREFLESTIKRDVAVAYRKYRAAAETLVLYSTQILPRAQENLRSVKAAYGIGEFSIFEVVNEQRRLTENVTGYNQSLREYYTALAELETAIGITIPASGLSPGASSVLPAQMDIPNQIDREKFLKSIQTFGIPTKSVPLNGRTTENR
jgi:cobalt-zinc-cadmium efflux system outer membrane protein